MRLLIDIDGGDVEENANLIALLNADPRTRTLRPGTEMRAPAPGTLGLVEVVAVFLASNVLLPVTVQVLGDYVKSRLPLRRGATPLTVKITRVDGPDGARETTVELTGDVESVVKALEAGLG